MTADHLDRALAEEFGDRAQEVHALKAKDAEFRALLARNRELWEQIQRVQNGLSPAEDAALDGLEKERLALLDEISNRLGAARQP